MSKTISSLTEKSQADLTDLIEVSSVDNSSLTGYISKKESLSTVANLVKKHNYSTTEQVVGTWIDGKPVYEKTVYDTTGYDGGVEIDIPTGITDAENIIEIKGICSYGSNNTWQTLPFSDEQGMSFTNSVIKACYFSRISGEFAIYGGSNYNTQYGTGITKIILTIRYTKTTN